MSSLAVSLILARLALGDLTPVAPGPGESFTAGSECTLKWDPDTTGTWKNVTIGLMSGSNDNMTVVTTVATGLDGTNSSLSPFQWTCPEVDPYSAIYFYQFTNGNDRTDSQWTARFTIASPSNSSVPPEHSQQPNGDSVPWGNGVLVSSSSQTSKIIAGNATSNGNGTFNSTQMQSTAPSATASGNVTSQPLMPTSSGSNGLAQPTQSSAPAIANVQLDHSDTSDDSAHDNNSNDSDGSDSGGDSDHSDSGNNSDAGNSDGDSGHGNSGNDVDPTATRSAHDDNGDATETVHHDDHSTEHSRPTDATDSDDSKDRSTMTHIQKVEATASPSSSGTGDSAGNGDDSDSDSQDGSSDNQDGSSDDQGGDSYDDSTMTTVFMTSSRMKKIQASQTASPTAAHASHVAPTVGLPSQGATDNGADASDTPPDDSAPSPSNTGRSPGVDGTDGVKLANAGVPQFQSSVSPTWLYATLVALWAL